MKPMIRTLLYCLIFFCLLPHTAAAQKNIIMLSPPLEAKPISFFADSIHTHAFIVDTRMVISSVKKTKRLFLVISRGDGIYLVNATPFDMLQWAKEVNGMIYIDEQVKPRTESGVINYNMSINRITTFWNKYPQLDGTGETVSVKENRVDTTDIDLVGRSRTSGYESPVIDPHATTMTTIITGAGNSSFKGKGVAPSARYSSADFITVLPDTPTYYLSNRIQVQNHSYGTGIQNFYGVNARAFDLSTTKDTTLLHVFSAGNSGTSTSGQGIYASVRAMANITGNMKMAKNVLLTGAMVDNGTIPTLSSKGPLYDGRVAPHLVAYGDDGTSGAAALVSGTALLLQQQYKKIFNMPAGSALIRSILINSAKDLGNEGPDHESGFGALDAANAMKTLVDARFINGSLASNTSVIYNIAIPGGMRRFKVSLTWNDEAAASGATKALIHDLDLVVVNNQTGEEILPWGLSVFPDADSLKKPARRVGDLLNTIEQVSFMDPAVGTYSIRVSAKNLSVSAVPFAIAYAYDSSNVFRWDHPMGNDLIATENGIRADWTSTYPLGTKGILELTKDNGLHWTQIASGVDLDAGYFGFSIPDSIAELRLRMIVNGQMFPTESFIVSPSMVTRYAYVCDTTILAYWNGVKGAEGYDLYRLEGNAMKSIKILGDTATTVSRNGNPNFSVAARVNGREGLRGVASDHTRQNVGCYINNFLASILNYRQASLNLQLGTLFQVKKVVITKVNANSRVLLSVDQPLLRNFVVIDTVLSQGLNIYEAVVSLQDGTEIRSRQEIVFYLNGKSHLIFPVPSFAGSPVYILTENVDDEHADIYDMNGKIVTSFLITEKQQIVPTSQLSKGRYVIRISKEGKIVERIQFIVL